MKTFLHRKAQRSATARKILHNAVHALEQRVLLSAFLPGDLAVYRVGTGSAALAATATPVYVDEYLPDANDTSPVQSILIGGGSGADTNPLTASGSATTEGNLTLSSNGQYLLVPGYDAATGATVTSGSSVVGEVGRVDSSGNVDTTTTIGTLLAGSNIRGAASADGTNIYVSGVEGAVYTMFGPPTAATVSISTTNLRAIEINNGQLYVDTTSNTTEVLGPLGTGLPTSGGPYTPTMLTGITDNATTPGLGLGGSFQFAFATLNPADPSPDTLYIADNYNGTIDKYSYSFTSDSWSITGSMGSYKAGTELLSAVTGIVAEPVAGGEQLFVTTGNKIYTITDPYGYDSNGGTAGTQAGGVFSTTPPLVTVATATTNEAFRGIAFVPQPAALSMYTQPTSQSVPLGTNATFTASAYGANQTVQWYVNVYNPMNMTYAGFTPVTNATNVYSGATTDTLNVLNTTQAESKDMYEAIFSSSTSSSVTSNAVTLTVTTTPVVQSVNPTSGSPAGNIAVTITGFNLANATAVDFGAGNPGTITADSSTSITVTNPTESGGTVDVTVTTSFGTSAISSADQFTYASTPTVTGFSSPTPAQGIDTGGTSVTITGTGFITGATVTFGGIAATGVVVNSYTSLTAITPAAATNSAGFPVDAAVHVVVTTSFGPSSTSSSDLFTYVPTTNAEAETLITGTKVTLDNDPIVTAILSYGGGESTNGLSYTNWAFLVNDGTGSIDIFGALPGSYTPTVGDAIAVKGTFDPFDSIPEVETITAISLIPAGGSIPPQGNSITALAPITINLATASVVPQPVSLAGQLVTINNATISGLDSSTFGTANLNETGADATISDSSDPAGINFFYYPSSYSAANAFFDGLSVPTGPVTMTGIVDVFGGVGEFVPISEVGYPEKFTISNLSNTSSDENANDFTDGFNEVARNSTITVTVTRTEVVPVGTTPYTDTGSVGYTLIPDSAVAGTDYTDTDPSVTSAPSAPEITGTLNFASTVQTQTFTINIAATPGDHGDKLFTIELDNPTTSNPAATANPTGYLPLVASGPSTIVINDPNSETTFSENSLNESANIGASGPETTTTNSVTSLTTSAVTVESSSGNGDESYSVLTYDDSSDPSDVLNTGETFRTIDGIELETQANTKSYTTAGLLNVYLVADTLTGNGPYPVATEPTSAGLKFDTTDDPTGGLYTQLGTTYLLGTIQYIGTSQVPGGYFPYNLTHLDPTGVGILAADLDSGAAFTIAITPGDSTVAATWLGSSTNDTGSPVLRVDYSTSYPTWLTSSANAATWIVPTSTVAVTGAATIVADPGSDDPIIFAGASGDVTIQPTPLSMTSDTPVHIGGVELTGGAEVSVPSVGAGRSATNHIVLVVAAGTNNVSIVNSTLDLADNDAIFLGGGLSTINASLTSGFNINGSWWTGDGITSSVAALTPIYKTLGVELDDNGHGTALTTSFDGQTVADGVVLVKYTDVGDADLSGTLTSADYIAIDNGFNMGLSGYSNGDFNYDGKINGDDYTLIDNSYNIQAISSLAHPLSEVASSSQQIAAVPLAKAAIAAAIPMSNSGGSASADDDFFSTNKKKKLAADLLG